MNAGKVVIDNPIRYVGQLIASKKRREQVQLL
ncbi:hypothetical protein SAMN05421687_1237 [Salimicrobium flavidum]|uniref:Uncharacterized protein n=1 Tax=Salimicrobium flavidum TaxID=570947 RepID=A0A1N7KY02_9BACI|nr:hypothetical protein SAMN05421687_1237 [Salimicrobium flavidum]